MQPRVLVVDDQEAIRLFLVATLGDKGYDVQQAATGGEALGLVAQTPPDLVLLDLVLPDMHGMEVLAAIKEREPETCVIVLTSFAEAEAAVQAMRLQAHDYVTKPINLDRLLEVIRGGLERSESSRRLRRNDLFADLPGAIPSVAPAMQDLYATVRKIAAGGRSTVLVEGESGVGKDIVAQLIHRNSPRADYPFLEINCASLPEALLESELFGHEKGAFTDASHQKLGLLELAHSGTLFLDEIGEMALPIQVKLLRVLERKSFRRVGGLEDIAVDVRIIAATNRELAKLVRQGIFREDLYYRLKVVELHLPPLRERGDDIPHLARHFLRIYNEEFDKRFEDFSSEALAALAAHDWPGNIRELRNCVERAVLLGSGDRLEADQLQIETLPAGPRDGLPARLEQILREPLREGGVRLDELVDALETTLIRKALEQTAGNQSEAARLLGLGRDRLRYRLKRREEPR